MEIGIESRDSTCGEGGGTSPDASTGCATESNADVVKGVVKEAAAQEIIVAPFYGFGPYPKVLRLVLADT